MKRSTARSHIWSMRRCAVIVAGLLIASWPAMSFGQTTASSQDSVVPWYRSIDLRGLISPGYTYNFNHPSDRTNQLRSYDIDANSMELDLAALSLQHVAARGGAGFRLDLDAGPHVPDVDHAAGLETPHFDVRQAFLSYVAAWGQGLTFDVGKFVTPLGFELIEGPRGYSDNASHSFLYGYAIPFSHTGLRLTYPVSDEFGIVAMAVNGWDNVIDNNDAKTAGLQFNLTLPATTLSLGGLYGAEKPNNDRDIRSVLDLAATQALTKQITFSLSADYGWEQNDLPASEELRLPVTAAWRGIAGYLHVALSDLFALTLRAEVFDDRDGVRTGAAQTLREITLTPEWRVAPGLVLRSDLRYDWSTVDVFEGRTGPAYYQPTASLNIVYGF